MAERFVATLKRDDVNGGAYRDAAHAQSSVGHFIKEIYNRQRLYSALAYLAPMVDTRRYDGVCLISCLTHRGHSTVSWLSSVFIRVHLWFQIYLKPPAHTGICTFIERMPRMKLE
jgi:hypothetical protein